jgi:FKBP-type peptidyl-prolyl cis-trans isomerase FkpA
MIKKLTSAFLLLALLAGCGKEDSNPCNAGDCATYNSCTRQAPASEVDSIRNYLIANSITNAVQHCSGMFYEIQTPGTGLFPNACSQVSVDYKGSLKTGEVFDSTNATTGPATFCMTGVITGFTNGLEKLKPGGRIRLFIPPSLGYGATPIRNSAGVTVIPANSILIFEVTLNSFK